MATLVPFLRHATRAALTADAVADAVLLDRFAAGRDEDAFAEIVRRHGPVVYRICRRLVGSAAADDAFQASFLVLATRLDAARAAGSLGGWLVGVAGRVARQMRRAAGRRARHESIAANSRPMDTCENPLDLADQFRVLDEELARLPDRLRDPVVLCLLQGRTQDEAAAALGRDARTLRRRLERAKQVLRARLERRGVVPAVAGALVAGAGSVSASVPNQLSSRTICTVFDFLTGGVGASPSAPVVLAKGVATTMFARKLMHLMAALAVGLVGFGVVLADDGPPMSPLLPHGPVAQPQPVLTDKDRADNTARLKAQSKGLAGIATKGERMILIEAIFMDVPAGFCEESGLEEWGGVLSPRETRMFNAIIRAAKEKGTLEVITRPRMKVRDNQTGFAQVGENFAYLAAPAVKGKEGKVIEEAKIAYQELGVILKATPTINADGKSLDLRVEATSSDVSPTPVDLGNGRSSPAFNFNSESINTVVPDSGSLVFGTRNKFTSDDQKVHQRIWVVTTHIVKGNAAITSGTKRPTAAKPPLPAPPAPILPALAAPAAGLVPVKPAAPPVTPMILPNPPRP
jgi:RNA polymerase sigma factor (sigma-70 family)